MTQIPPLSAIATGRKLHKRSRRLVYGGLSTSNQSLEANILQASMSCKLCTVYSRIIFVVRYTTFRNLTTKGIQTKPGTTRISLDKKLKDQNGALYTFSLFRFFTPLNQADGFMRFFSLHVQN